MTEAQDRKFLDMFSVVVGVLLGVAVGIFAIASYLGHMSEARGVEDAEYRRAVVERIAPIGKVAIAGRDNSALAAPVPVASAAPRTLAVLSGDQVYHTACVACHGTGLAGAPKFGDRAAWAPRVSKGLALLHTHALQGFQGKSGVMLPKGGRPDLADQSVLNGVDYMVAAAK